MLRIISIGAFIYLLTERDKKFLSLNSFIKFQVTVYNLKNVKFINISSDTNTNITLHKSFGK